MSGKPATLMQSSVTRVKRWSSNCLWGGIFLLIAGCACIGSLRDRRYKPKKPVQHFKTYIDEQGRSWAVIPDDAVWSEGGSKVYAGGW